MEALSPEFADFLPGANNRRYFFGQQLPSLRKCFSEAAVTSIPNSKKDAKQCRKMKQNPNRPWKRKAGICQKTYFYIWRVPSF
jgi:hypothetical protein